MKKHFLFLTVLIVGILMAGCKHNAVDPAIEPETEASGQVTISIGNGARTVVPVDWDISEVSTWTVTFDSTTEGVDNIVKTMSSDSDGIFQLPYGEYKVSVEGTGTHVPSSGSPATYTLYGEAAENKTVSETEISVTINVALKKTSDGSGNFSYAIKFTNQDFVKAYDDGSGYEFSAYLAPVTAPKDETKQISLKVTPDTTEDASSGNTVLELILAEKRDGEGNITTPITSGYYYLVITYEYDNVTFPLALNDSLIEIADGMTTTSTDNTDSDFEGVVTKTFYVDNSSSYNGLIPSYPKEFNSALGWLKDNQSEWNVANLYFESGDTDGIASYEDWVKACAPYYKYNSDEDGFINPTEEDDNKSVKVYVGDSLSYILYGGEIHITSECNNSYICLARDNDENGAIYVECDDGLYGTELTLYQIGVPVQLTGISIEYPTVHSYLTPALAEDCNPSSSDGYLYIELGMLEEGKTMVNNNIDLAVLSNSSPWYDETSYITLTKSSESIMSCYSASAGSASITLGTAIPEFTINGDDTVVMGNDNSTYNCVVDSDSLSAETYSFEWFLNGNSTGTDEKFILNPATNSYVKIGENTLMVVVSKDGEYRSAAAKVTVKQINLLYSVTNDSSVSYYRSTNPSSSDTRLSSGSDTLDNVFRVDNNTYYGFISTSEWDDASSSWVNTFTLVYFDGTDFDTTSYANYTYPTGMETIYGGYYDADTGYLYFSAKAYSAGYKYYLVAIDTTNPPDSSTAAAYVQMTDTYPLYKSMFVKNGTLYGSTMAYSNSPVRYTYGNCISYRTVTFNGSTLTLGDASSIDLITTVYQSSETLASNHCVNATDFYYYDGGIYFLCKFGAYEFAHDSANDYMKSFGYVGKLSSDGTSVDSSYKVGQTITSDQKTTDYEYATDTTITGCTPNGNMGFWGPERIVAVKKDNVIMIEDCGIYIKSVTSGNINVGTKSSIFTVNLKEKTYTYAASSVVFGRLGSTSGWTME